MIDTSEVDDTDSIKNTNSMVKTQVGVQQWSTHFYVRIREINGIQGYIKFEQRKANTKIKNIFYHIHQKEVTKIERIKK